jgi:hypothetical protein
LHEKRLRYYPVIRKGAYNNANARNSNNTTSYRYD